jgi:RHS repeat-associated protein
MPPLSVPAYDIAGNLLFQHSMDGGDRRMLMDAAGQPLLAWDYNERADATTPRIIKEHRRFEARCDVLHRPTERRLRVRDESTGDTREFLIERLRYGEGVPNDQASNLRGQLWRHVDNSGLLQTDAIDLSGKPLTVRRRLASEIEAPIIDWKNRDLDDIHAAAAPGFESDVFTQRTAYDALGRMTRHYNWHVESPINPGTSERVAVYLPQYNRRGALTAEALLVRARKTAAGHESVPNVTRSQQAIERITYDAKGQKLTLDLGNGTSTRYTYDDATFRLVHLYTRRDARFTSDCASNTANDARPLRPCGVQNLHYHYDPVGNITHIQDDAQQTIYFANAVAEPSSDYVYDAIYRLIEGTGRENAAAIGAPAQPEGPWPKGTFPSSDFTRAYTQRYRYDRVGNIEEMRHLAPSNTPAEPPGWTRNYRYASDSNRLLETWFGRTRDPTLGRDNVVYGYDTHGSMLNLNAAADPFDLRWDWNDMIHTINLGGGGRAWYQYGADKQRCRKRLVRNPALLDGTIKEERIYLGGYERFRRDTGDPNDPVEEIESHHLFESEQRVLLVDDVLKTNRRHANGASYKTDPVFRYQYNNHLGSACLELDHQAEITFFEEYHPYGTSAYRAAKNGIEAPAKRYRYTGMERDEESGLSYHAARHYLPWLGRWSSCDPAWDISRPNNYCYAGCMPTTKFDVTGRAHDNPPYYFHIDRTAPLVAKDWKPPNLEEPPDSPMSHADFSYRFGYYDREQYQGFLDQGWRPSDALLHSLQLDETHIKKDVKLEATARAWKGWWFYDEVRIYKSGIKAPPPISGAQAPPYVFQRGWWYPLEVWEELAEARANLSSDRPEASPAFNFADTLQMDYVLNFDKLIREKHGPLPESKRFDSDLDLLEYKVAYFLDKLRVASETRNTGLSGPFVRSLGDVEQDRKELSLSPLLKPPPSPAAPRFGIGLGPNYDFQLGSTDIEASLGGTVFEVTQRYSQITQDLRPSTFDIKNQSLSVWGRLEFHF